MNLFKSLKNRKGMSGAIKASIVILTLAFAIASVSFVKPVLAVHDSIITITPNIANCDELGNTFIVNVKNSESSADAIFEVRIYDESYAETYGIVEFHCGPAPVGWQLFDYTIPGPNYYGYCEYKTQQYGAYIIKPGKDVNFTFDAVMSQEKCYSKFLVSTLDNKQPEGEHEYHTPQVDIDCSNPLIDKQVGEPKIPGTGFDWWITQNTNIHLSASDNTGECDLGLDYCQYRWSVDGGEPTKWIIKKDGKVLNWDFNFGEDSNHHLEVECYDVAKNKATLEEDDKVDSTIPETTKKFIGPQKIEDGVEWIDGVTTVELTPVDPDPTKQGCNIGVEKTWYVNTLADGDKPCWDPKTYCTPICDNPYSNPDNAACIEKAQKWCTEHWKDDWDSWEDCVEDMVYNECKINCNGLQWKLYRGTPIPKDEESCHILQFFSVDYLGNVEKTNTNCFFVDKTPPKIDKVVGDPNVPVRDGFDYWVTQNTPITLKCEDVGPHPSNDVTIYWKYTVDGGSEVKGSYKGEEKTIYFPEDSVHVLEFWCIDAVNKESIHDIETFKVDTVPPSITKTMIGEDHLGECPPGPTPAEPCYVRDDGENGVHIAVSDGGAICAVDQTTCSYGLWWYTDETTCKGKYGEKAWDGTKCKVDSGSFGEEGKDIIFREDSEHRLFIQCRDALNNWNSMDIETFLVDSTPPVTQKTYGDPTKVLDGYRWITKDTPITLTTKDEKVGPKKIFVRVTKLDVSDSECIKECDFTGAKDFKEYVVYKNPDSIEFKIPEDSCHLIEFYAVDKLGNAEGLHKQCVFVDNKDPALVKEVGDPSIFVRGTGCGDIIYDGKAPEGSGATIEPDHLGSLSEPIVLEPGESIMEEKIVTTDVIPIGKLDVLFAFDLTGSMGGIIGSAKTNAISIMTAIQGLVTDAQFGVGSFMDYNGYFDYCGYDSWYGSSGDYPWNLDQDITSDTTDVSDAITGLSLGSGDDGPESYARALYETQFAGWRTGARKVVVIFEDSVPHDCDLGDYDISCDYSTGKDPGRDNTVETSDDLDWTDVVAQLKAAGVSVVTVDSGDGYCSDVWQYASDETDGLYATLGGEGLPEKIVELMTEITGKIKKLTLEPKPGFEDWVKWDPEYYEDVEGLDTVDFDVKITVPEDQPGGDYHLYIKVMGDGSILAVQEIFIKVDAPECEGGEDYWWVRDKVTPITLDCDDSWDGKAPHPVGQETMCYRISFDDPKTPWLTDKYCEKFGGEMTGDSIDAWCCDYVGEEGDRGVVNNYEFTFLEDSVHDLEFYCKDHLGNGGNVVDKEYFHVDSIAPVTTKTYLGPFYKDGEGHEFIDTVSTVKLEATDGGDICHVDGVKTYYRVINLKEEGWDYCKGMCDEWNPDHEGKWLTYKDPFTLDESCNIIEFYSEDALGNAEKVDWQCVFSDHTAPVTTKTYGKPFFTDDGKSDWIAPSTEIHLEAIDPEPHPSGAKETYYRFTLVDDKYCRDQTLCQEYDGKIDKAYDKASPKLMFNIPEESCHLIEYYSVDNVGKVEDVKRQCVFVDKTPPIVVKTISDPKEHWAGDNTFYPGLTDRCWSTDPAKMIECWKITLGTELKLSCNDPEPHPVDRSKMCFQIELDGESTPELMKKYCDKYKGTVEDGWCCNEIGIEEMTFHFLEESQHDLKVKCIDALGNKGNVDEEKFKVEGCTWDIPLYKKWNLISFPFTLLNDDPNVVFKDVKGNLTAVWTYDNGVWYTWIPGVGGTLASIKPGWGYWTLAKEDTEIPIAGSLMSPGPFIVPPSKELQSGWNLIGYYGEGFYKTDKGECILEGEPVYCALNSLVDTQQGFPRWSSLWNYFNKGGDVAGWTGLDACISRKWSPDEMEPGKGYWVEMDVKDSYAPATNCIWDKDFKCVMPSIPA